MMDFIKVLFSGSKGNTILISYNDNIYLIDIGVSYKRLLQSIGDSVKLDNASIFITHTHGDHVKGLLQLQKRASINIYGSASLAKKYCNVNIIDDSLEINDIKVEVLNLSHDCSDTLGYILYLGDYKVVVVSDTGYISDYNLHKMHGPCVLLLEANHDVEMLMNGKYTWPLKNRILGDYGHLSNRQFKNYVKNVATNDTKYLVALHLSEENNCEQIVEEELENIDVEHKYVATQEHGADIIYLNWR